MKWIEHLLEIDFELPGCVVSGGFLRDNILEVPYRDIDVFVQTNNHNLFKLGFRETKLFETEYDHDRINAIWNRGHLNVIEVSSSVTAQNSNDYNDIGICKASWSKAEGLLVDPRFISDVTNKTLTVHRHEWGAKGVRAHLDRLKLKFPDYTEVWEKPTVEKEEEDPWFQSMF